MSSARQAQSTGGRSRLLIVALTLVAALACSPDGEGEPAAAPPTTPPAPTEAPAPPVTFGLWGDTPYTAEAEAKVRTMIAEMNAADLAFSVFDGDLKGAGPCTDRVYAEALARFNSLAAPLVYVPGDNEWTDCLGTDPLERLARVRRVLCAGDRSLGQRTMPLERQSADYPEHTRWRAGGVVFVGLHVVGSNNGKVTDPGDVRTPAQRAAANAEHEARDAAARAWMHDSFELALRERAAGVMLVIQANPGFEVMSPADRAGQRLDGFDAFLDALRAETRRFAKPVALVHGDTHRYRLDRPLLERSGAPIPNLVRLETWGHPFVSWVKATVDARDPQVFRFEPQRLY
ncbi:MAG TPA: hypothetical protein VHG90_00115 [Acidimicrobiales bacterium]|nr:hypothetical protein [Acidimicrobiales bacterium]